MSGSIRVAELFAGVGGFRLGLEGHPDSDEDTGFKVVWSNQWEPPGKYTPSKRKGKRTGPKRRCSATTKRGTRCRAEQRGIKEGGFCTVHRQMKRQGVQWASRIYVERFGPENHSNVDINRLAQNEGSVVETIHETIPEHDLLVGGFPCQDYSVARTKSGELGIKGEKGKLWVPIRNIIDHVRGEEGKRAIKIVLLENVPRLLNSPASARGQNFAAILSELLSMGYHVEWRVIDASKYGFPQKRKRVFIFAYRNYTYNGVGDTNGYVNYGCSKVSTRGRMQRWLLGEKGEGIDEMEIGPFAKAFPLKAALAPRPMELPTTGFTEKDSVFGPAGYAWKKRTHTENGIRRHSVQMFWNITDIESEYEDERQTLGDVLVDEHDPNYELDNENGLLDRYAYMKGEQKEWRIRKEDADKAREIEGDLWELYQKCTRGYRTDWWAESREDRRYLAGLEQGLIYDYTAGAMAYPDPLDKASRTVVTAEIGKSVSRMRHVIEYEKGKFRGLMPLELERLNQFPDNWTAFDGISDSKRGFLMGNALVVGVVTRLAGPLAELIRDRSE